VITGENFEYVKKTARNRANISTEKLF